MKIKIAIIFLYTFLLFTFEISAGSFSSIGRSVVRKQQEYQKYKHKDSVNQDRWNQDQSEKEYDSAEDLDSNDFSTIPALSLSDEMRMQLLQNEINQILSVAKNKLYKNPQEAFLILYNAAEANEKRFERLAELKCDCELLEDEYGSLSVRVAEKLWSHIKEQSADQVSIKEKLKEFLVHLDVLLWHTFKFYNDQAAKDRLQAIEEQVYGTALKLDASSLSAYGQNDFSEFAPE